MRAEEERRLKRIRQTVVTSINNLPIRVEDVVEGGPLRYPEDLGKAGVVVGNQPRLGKRRDEPSPCSNSRKAKRCSTTTAIEFGSTSPKKCRASSCCARAKLRSPRCTTSKKKSRSSNETIPDLLPGIQIEPYYDRSELIGVTTETVRENLVVGMVLVTVILLMFLSNVRSALIVAINIPLALLFAFSVLYMRGLSANLLSIGAVDFGIIVDSSVIMVENIYRHLSSGEFAELPLKQRILAATKEVEKGLFFTTTIMVCAFLPLFTMKGPEGQIFGPMADTYAFALGGALLLALTVAPVLCLCFSRTCSRPDNAGPAG